MLVLGRKVGERVMVDVAGIRVTLVVVEIDRGRVKLGIDAPREVAIFREELLPQPGEPKE